MRRMSGDHKRQGIALQLNEIYSSGWVVKLEEDRVSDGCWFFVRTTVVRPHRSTNEEYATTQSN